jgi:rubrerythrin
MTQDQLEQLAELITQKIMDEFDKRIAERYQATTPEEFHHSIDIFGNVKHVSKKDILLAQLQQLDEKWQELLEDEKYELLVELKEIYEKIKKEIDKL